MLGIPFLITSISIALVGVLMTLSRIKETSVKDRRFVLSLELICYFFGIGAYSYYLAGFVAK